MKNTRKTKFEVGDRVRVVQNLAGSMDHGKRETGTIIANLPLPNSFTGFYPGVVYKRDDNSGDQVVAIEGELETINE